MIHPAAIQDAATPSLMRGLINDSAVKPAVTGNGDEVSMSCRVIPQAAQAIHSDGLATSYRAASVVGTSDRDQARLDGSKNLKVLFP